MHCTNTGVYYESELEAIVNACGSRRAAPGLSPLALASCAKTGPNGLDPGTTTGPSDQYPGAALFEGLVSLAPGTLEPVAALSTHYSR